MANTDIFLGSGASITFIPENDIYIGGRKINDDAFDGSELTQIEVDSTFSGIFSLVVDLYKGCLVERYNSSNALQSTHRITTNTADNITITPSASPASGDYFVIKSYGSPVPAPTSTAKRLLSDEWLGITECLASICLALNLFFSH